MNTAGMHVPLWMDSGAPSIGWGQNPAYPVQEAAYFGNVMRADSDGNVTPGTARDATTSERDRAGPSGRRRRERHLQEPVGQGRPLRQSLHEVRVGRLHVVQRRHQPDHRLAAGELQPGLRRQLHLQARQRELAPGARRRRRLHRRERRGRFSGTTTAPPTPSSSGSSRWPPASGRSSTSFRARPSPTGTASSANVMMNSYNGTVDRQLGHRRPQRPLHHPQQGDERVPARPERTAPARRSTSRRATAAARTPTGIWSRSTRSSRRNA